MNILHVYKTSFPTSVGGVEFFMDALCNNITCQFGVKNTILSLANSPLDKPISISNYKVVQAKQNLFVASTGFSVSAFAKFNKLAKEADIIHYHFPNPFADMLHFICGIKKPTIVTYHSDIIKQKYLFKLYRPLMHRFLSSVDRIIATSPNYLATSEVLQLFKDKVDVIPIGIGSKEKCIAKNNKRVEYWKNKLPKTFFLFVGALRYYKGLSVALNAIKKTNYNLVIAGSGGVERELRAQAKNNNLNNAFFVGNVSEEDKCILHSLSYAFVFPSHLRSEAFGISLVEAASLGKALISCEIGTGTSFVNIHHKTGLVVAPSSINELREAMKYLIENPDKNQEFGLNAKKRYQQLFTNAKQGEAYFNCYKKLLDSS